jgi:hypothetical protein
MGPISAIETSSSTQMWSAIFRAPRIVTVYVGRLCGPKVLHCDDCVNGQGTIDTRRYSLVFITGGSTNYGNGASESGMSKYRRYLIQTVHRPLVPELQAT